MSSIKRIIIICLTTLIILPMGVRAETISFHGSGSPSGAGGGGGSNGKDELYNSDLLRISLVYVGNKSFKRISTVYYKNSYGNDSNHDKFLNHYLYGSDKYSYKSNKLGSGHILVTTYENNGTTTKYHDVLHESGDNKNVYTNPKYNFWTDESMGNVVKNNIASFFNASKSISGLLYEDSDPNLNGYINKNKATWKENFYYLLSQLKVCSILGCDNNAYHIWKIINVLSDNKYADYNQGYAQKVEDLKNYIITVEPVFRFADGENGKDGSLFATTKAYSNYVINRYRNPNSLIGMGYSGFCSAAKTLYSDWNLGGAKLDPCNVTYDKFYEANNGYGFVYFTIVDTNKTYVEKCDPNTQCCYNATGNNIVQNGTHYNDSNGKRQPCCDKKKSCCYSAPNDNSYHREFTDEDDYDDARYKKVNNSFKECSNCKPKVTTTACDDNPNAASIVESDKVDICTFDKSKKSGIKLSSGGNDVTAACRDELIVNTPGKKDTSSYKSGNYFILDKNKNLMPSISVKRQCYVKKDSSFNENLQKTKLDIKKAPKVNFYYDNDEESKNDIAKSFNFSPEITKLDTTYYDLGNNYNNSNKTLISDVSNVSSNNYVLREEIMDITYKSKAYVKALTGKVTYIKPSDSDIDSYYESEDNSVFVSYKTKNSTYNYTLKFDFGNLGNDNLKEELKENKLFENDNNYTCTYLVKNNLVINGEKLNYFYRTVDLDNINHKNRKLGSNWETTKYDNKNDCIIKNKDQASRKSCLIQLDMKNKEKSYKELTEQGDSYSFRLTPTDMKAIRKYNVERNKNSDGFNDFNLEKYDNPNYKYIFYTSNFLTCISGSECKNLGTSLNNYLDGKDRNNQINSIRNSLVSKLDNLENITK